MKTKIEAYFAKQEDALVAAISRLIRIPSIKGEPAPGRPFGEGPAKALEEALTLAAELGLPGENLEGYVGVVDLDKEQDTALHILAHLDVVAGGTGWSVTAPFEPKVVDGLLYGRGVSDDKGPLVAALFAMKAVKDLGAPLSRNVRLILGTDEESGFSDIHWYYERHPYAPYAFSPDSSFPLTNLEKGHFQPHLNKRWEEDLASPQVISLTGSPAVNMVPPTATAMVRGLTDEEIMPLCKKVEEELSVTLTLSSQKEGVHLDCVGKGTHASTPEDGNNALTALLTLLNRLPLADCESSRTLRALSALFPHGDHSGAALGIAQSDPLSGPLTITLSMMSLTSTGLEARFDCRTPLCATEENCLQKATAAFSAIGVNLEGHINPAHYVPEDSPFVQSLLHCYEQYSGQKGYCIATGGGTYVHDIPGGVAFGACMPGFDSGLHGPDERMPIADLLTACKIFTGAILDLCSQ